MTSKTALWTYALVPDVEVRPANGGALLRTATTQTWVEVATGELEVLELLAGNGGSEAQLQSHLRLTDTNRNSEARCAALLFRLERLGLLVRCLSSSKRRLISCIPLRPPPDSRPERAPEGPLRLSTRALARAHGGAVSLEAAGSWATMRIHDRDLLPLLYDLAAGRPAAELAAAVPTLSEAAVLAVLALMSWCELLDCVDHEAWPTHDLLFHARTRAGYARVLLGKTISGEETAPQLAPSATTDGARRLALAPPDLPRILAEDPPFALVSERRRSTRCHGSVPLTAGQLSEFLFRTLHERGGRRPYPSGGACYPLKAYLAVHRCLGVAPGLYAYDAARHELITVGEPGLGLDRLLADAAGAANVAAPPQILLVLAAQYMRTQRVYGDLSYSLILKEVGAVFQAAMMAAAAMGLSTCPLGCGNALLFSELAGVNPRTETSVGELMVGSLDDNL
jgi:SagB-type dehydrogenase family enzyme